MEHAKAWFSPTFSPEHGVYVMLLGSFLIGAAAAQEWTGATTLALLCAMAGLQAEHPLTLQIKQRRSWKLRFLVWGGIYAAIALGLALYLALETPALLWLYAVAIATFCVDAIAVYHRQQKAIWNELLTFAAVCLATPLAYGATTGTLNTPSIWGLWLLNSLFFSSAIFTVKLRKPKTSSLLPGLVYHSMATLAVSALVYAGALSIAAALTFSVVVVKFVGILLCQNWYRTTKIQWVALLETLSALIFMSLVALSVLPARLIP